MRKAVLAFLAVVLAATALPAAAVFQAPSNVDPPIISWQPPATWSMAPAGGLTKYAEIGAGPVPFYPVTPCRQYDSRSTTALANNTPRTVTLSGVPCNIPSTSNAVAVNITIFSITGAGSNGVFKVDTVSPPVTAWINYPPTETQRGNAGVVATNGSGGIVVQVNQGAGSVHFTVDVFGYYYNGNTSNMPTGDYFSILGNFSNGGVLFSVNYQASATNSHGVRGRTMSTGAGSAGVLGEASGAAGEGIFGVKGVVSSGSWESSGVLGLNSGGSGAVGQSPTAGVTGDSATGYGVLGFSTGIGVSGFKIDGAGATLSSGHLGYNVGYGVYAFGNLGASGTKPFVEPHPYDAAKVIRYVALEGPEAGTYFRGSGQIENGMAVIEVPDSFRWVTDESGLTVTLTAVGNPAQLWIESEDLNRIVVRSTRDVKFHYLAQGVRKAYRDWQVVADGTEYAPNSPKETMPVYLSEEAKKRLVQNGTYNPDGTVNMGTAERLGWAQKWREEERLRQQAVSRPVPEPGNAPR